MAVGVTATAAMMFIGKGDCRLAEWLFVIANVGISASFVFYDSLLPHVASEDEMDRVSSAGYALGYLGGGILLLDQPALDSQAALVRPDRCRHGVALLLPERRGVVGRLLDSALPHGARASGAPKRRRRRAPAAR